MRDGPRVGADIGATKLLLVALHGGARRLGRVPTGPGTSLERIEREIRAFVSRLGAPPASLGIAVPGLVDASGAVSSCDSIPGLVGWRAEEGFADLGCPVCVLNDADAALAEETHDLIPGATAAIVMSGTWIGAAVHANGAPLLGAKGWAGELGFAPVTFRNGRVCSLDEVAAGGAVARRLSVDGARLYELTERGDPEASAAVREAGTAMGLGLATVVNLLNPDLLSLGGGAFELPGYREAALESAERWSLPDLWRVCAVRPARAGAAVAALGAARVAAPQLPA